MIEAEEISNCFAIDYKGLALSLSVLADNELLKFSDCLPIKPLWTPDISAVTFCMLQGVGGMQDCSIGYQGRKS